MTDSNETSAGPSRVLHLFGRMNRGGAEVATVKAVSLLDTERVQTDFCSLSGLPGDLDDEIRALGSHVRYLRRGPLAPWHFYALLETGEYSVVHSHVLFSSGPLLTVAWLAGVPIRVAHFHSMSDGKPSRLWRRAWTAVRVAMVDRFATHIVGVGDGVLDATWPSHKTEPRCRTVYMGTDLDRFRYSRKRRVVGREALGLESGDPVILHVGNQREAKNHLHVVQVFAEVCRRDKSAHLILVGRRSATTAESINRIAKRHGIAHCVHSLGVRDDIPELMSVADVLLLPSKWEGFPVVVVEAAAADLPVVGSDIPSLREAASMIRHINLLPLSASMDEWAKAVLTSISGRDRDSSTRYRQLAEHGFDIASYAESMSLIWIGNR